MSAIATAPSRSLQQRREALERANDVRFRRARLKRDLKAGRPVVPLIVDPPAWLEAMKVMDLLLATPKYGRVKVTKLLARYAISPSKNVGGLSERQRAQLVAVLQFRESR